MTGTGILRLFAAAGALAGPVWAQPRPIDTQRSVITIHVGKAGLLSAAGHEHTVTAPIASGELDDSAAPRAAFTVDAASLQVQPDAKVSAKDQAEIQNNMQTKALESARYPRIEFRSTAAAAKGADAWHVDGILTLHGVSKPIGVEVRRQGGAYTADVRLKQTDFGMQPISVAGVVKVKNELDLHFEIYAK